MKISSIRTMRNPDIPRTMETKLISGITKIDDFQPSGEENMHENRRRIGLPYINNAKAVLITLAINLAILFLLYFPVGITFSGVLWDSLFCGIITVAINMTIIYPRMKKMKTAGELPSQVPISRLMQALPANPFALGVLFALVFGAVAVGVSALILTFFSVSSMTFIPWAVYKLIFSVVLSIKIVEYCIFRYVQPDWANTHNKAEVSDESSSAPVKNPLPKISMLSEMYGSVTGNIALNIINGTILGGVVVAGDGSVVIYPTALLGMPISGLIFGLITGVLVTRGVMKSMDASILAAEKTATARPVQEGVTVKSDRRIAWMPKGKGALTCLICIATMLFSAFALTAVMALFNIALMNFFQYVVYITLYATLLSKPLSALLVWRCSQPDYHIYIREKQQRKRGFDL